MQKSEHGAGGLSVALKDDRNAALSLGDVAAQAVIVLKTMEIEPVDDAVLTLVAAIANERGGEMTCGEFADFLGAEILRSAAMTCVRFPNIVLTDSARKALELVTGIAIPVWRQKGAAEEYDPNESLERHRNFEAKGFPGHFNLDAVEEHMQAIANSGDASPVNRHLAEAMIDVIKDKAQWWDGDGPVRPVDLAVVLGMRLMLELEGEETK